MYRYCKLATVEVRVKRETGTITLHYTPHGVDIELASRCKVMSVEEVSQLADRLRFHRIDGVLMLNRPTNEVGTVGSVAN